MLNIKTNKEESPSQHSYFDDAKVTFFSQTQEKNKKIIIFFPTERKKCVPLHFEKYIINTFNYIIV